MMEPTQETEEAIVAALASLSVHDVAPAGRELIRRRAHAILLAGRCGAVSDRLPPVPAARPWPAARRLVEPLAAAVFAAVYLTWALARSVSLLVR